MLDTLRKRFALTAALVASAVALVAGFASYQLTYRNARHAAQDTISGLVGAVQNTAAVGAYAGDRVLMEEIASGLARHPLVAQVRISSSVGGTVERSRPQLPPQATAPAALAALRVDQALKSPFDASETVGRLWVQGDLAAVQQAARDQALWLALPMAAQVLLLALLLDLAAARLLSRPMVWLARQVEQLAPGTSERLALSDKHRGDEIGLLVLSTNRLLQATETALERERLLHAEVTAMESQLRQLIDSSSAAIFVLGRDGRLVQSNPTLARICTGRAETALHAQGAAFIEQNFHEPTLVRELIEAAWLSDQTVAADLRLLDDSRGERWVHGLLSPLRHEGAADEDLIEGVIYDVTQRRHDELRALHQASHDALTGLYNRAALRRALASALQQGKSLSLFYIDLDGFKAVNDTLGHEAGDAVLAESAARLKRVLRRNSDLVARLGGDEFVLLLHADLSETWVSELAWRITQVLAEPFLLAGGQTVQIGASVGIAGSPQHASDAEGLLHQADQAMYQVKRSGKNGVADPDGLIQPAQPAPR